MADMLDDMEGVDMPMETEPAPPPTESPDAADFDALAKDFYDTGDPKTLKLAIKACLAEEQAGGYEDETDADVAELFGGGVAGLS